jgi:hypothetical protein
VRLDGEHAKEMSTSPRMTFLALAWNMKVSQETTDQRKLRWKKYMKLSEQRIRMVKESMKPDAVFEVREENFCALPAPVMVSWP